MKRIGVVWICFMMVFSVFAGVVSAGPWDTSAIVYNESIPAVGDNETTASQAYGLMGDVFTENRGQLENDDVSYYLSSGSGGIAFSPSSVMMTSIEYDKITKAEESHERFNRDVLDMELPSEPTPGKGNAIKLNFVDANDVVPVGRNHTPWQNNYFIGSDPSQWRTNVPNYREIVYENLWDGIDLVYYTRNGNLKYDFIVHPYADHTKIKVKVEGHDGLSVTSDGSLKIKTGLGPGSDILDSGLDVFYAEDEDAKVSAKFMLSDDTYSFMLGERDSFQTLVIDPMYSTFLGGAGNYDRGYGIAVDSNGYAYVTGLTISADFPVTAGAFDTTHNSNDDVFVTKLNQTGGSLVYSTFLGGASDEMGYGIAVDSNDYAYVIGITNSIDFPTSVGAFDITQNGIDDVFITKLNQTGGALEYSTFLGGASDDIGYGIAVNSNGYAYVTGYTESTDFPITAGAFDTTHNGGADAFIVKLSQSGGSLEYSTFLGGSGNDWGFDIEIDNSGYAYVTGQTSTVFPTTVGAFDTTYNGGADAFIVKLSQSGGSLEYSTYLDGSNGHGRGLGIAVDFNGYAYVNGYTSSTDFPTTVDAFDTTFNDGLYDVFVTKLSQSGDSLEYSTYLGGSDFDEGQSIAVDSNGYAYVTGYTYSPDFPTTAGAFDITHNGNRDAYITKLSQSGGSLEYSTFLGGSSYDEGNGIAVDSNGCSYVTGYAGSTIWDSFPTTIGAFDTTHNGGFQDAFVAKFDLMAPIANAGPDQTVDEDTLVTFDGSGSADNIGIDNYTWMFDDGGQQILFDVGPTYTFDTPGLYNVTLNVTDAAGIWDTDNMTVTVLDLTQPNISSVADQPDPQEIGGWVNITVDVTDNAAVKEVWINITYPDNTWTNQSMTIGTAPEYYHNTTYTILGLYNYSIWANDTSDNWNTSVSASHNFTIIEDTTPPLITLNSPTNNSVILGGTILDFNVKDFNLNIVNYSINGGANESFPAPYDIETIGWDSANYSIQIYANDFFDNLAVDIFEFSVTWVRPPIRINSNADFTPANGVTGGSGTQLDPWVIEGWIINGTGYGYSIYVGNTTDYFTIKNCTLFDVSGVISPPYFWNSALFLYNVQNGTIVNNTITGQLGDLALIDPMDISTMINTSLFGIQLKDSNDNQILNNSISDFYMYGVYLSRSDMNVIQDNILDLTIYSGIYLSVSDQNMIVNNSITNSSRAIKLFASSFDTLLDNKITNSGISLSGNGLSDFNTHYIDTSNTVNGKPVYYWKNVTGGTVPLGGGQVILANCSGVTVANQSITNTSAALFIVYSSNITINDNYITNNSQAVDADLSDRMVIHNNTFINNGQGLSMSRSNDNVIKFNTAYQNRNGISIIFSDNNEISNNNVSDNENNGIIISYSNNNKILNNSLYKNENYSLYGYDAQNNIIDNNTISENKFGIFFDGGFSLSSGNIITNNSLSSNTGYGLNFTVGTDNNQIYHNEIVNNFVQAIDNGTNQWDNGYPSGGNYWSDYTGVDQNSTPTQDTPPPDGIGDTPYNIDLDSQDNYPLMYPVSEDPPYIILNSPANNSIIFAGTILDFDVGDRKKDLDVVNYSVNGGANTSFPEPFDVDTSGWIDGLYVIQIFANDTDGNNVTRSYNFIIDSTDPTIILVTPGNNSVIPAGTILDFDVSDPNLNDVNYSINGGANTTFPAPYDIDTTGWTDGLYVIEVHANDTVDNNVSRSYNFTIDSTDPVILLNSPVNNSVIKAGTIIDLDVVDDNIDIVNYSVNGGANQTLNSPYEIDTVGWSDGDYKIEVRANDIVGNEAVRWYNFTIDSTTPIISLNSPVNNSVIFAGTILDFDVSDPYLNIVNYSVNGGANTSFPAPYDIDTTGWADGLYAIEIHANDTAGNEVVRWYNFIIDSTDPVILLNSPSNNSIIPAGTIIDLVVVDNNIDIVNYSVNGGANQTLITPYDIDTTGWTDGLYAIEIHAIDDAGNTAVEIYEFTIDSTTPAIILNSPTNNSVIPAGTILDFDVSDSYLNVVNYSVNGGANTSFPAPYDIDTTGWVDGTYTIEVHAIDDAGNTAIEIYEFTIDSTAPDIILNSPANNSVIPAGTILDFDISDPYLNIVNYSINGGANVSFPAPYDIDTTGWSDGTYTIEIHANDTVGNNAVRFYTFTIDSTVPVITLNSPTNNTIILPGTTLDLDVIDDNIDVVNYSINGGANQTLNSPYDIDTTGWPDNIYIIEVHAIDKAGNTAIEIYEFMIDTTPPTVDAGTDAFVDSPYVQDATATDTTSGISTYQWTMVSGPGTVTFTLDNVEDPQISADTEGTYVCRLTVTDNAGNSNFDELTLVWDLTSPTVDAGVDAVVNAMYLQDATVSDGLSGVNSYSWTKQSGPGVVTFGTSIAEDTTISADADGTYIIRLTVTDLAGNTAYDEFTLIWDTTAPSVEAGTDATVNGLFTQNATVSDGLSGVNTYSWTKQSGPGAVTFGTSNAEDTTISADADGTYTIRLTVIDNAGNSVFDEFTLMWDTTPPTVDAGIDTFVNSPYTQDATATDATSGISTYQWTKQSGPGIVTFGAPNAKDTTISADADGTYIIRLTVTDNAGNSQFDEFTLIWDTTLPDITLNSPSNNSFILPGTILDFDVTDTNLNSVIYSKNSGTNVSFLTPYDINTIGWSEGYHIIEIYANDTAGNEAVKIFIINITYDVSPPTTDITIGNPQYQSWALFVNASTEINLTATDGNGSGVASTWYRIWKPMHYSLGIFQVIVEGGWSDWQVYTGNFTIYDLWHEGDVVYVEFNSTDNVGLSESPNNISVRLDYSAPTTTLNLEESAGITNSTTQLSLTSIDAKENWHGLDLGPIGSGVASTWYRIWAFGTWTSWTQYISNFTITGTDGVRYIEYYSIDNLGQVEEILNQSIILNNGPPSIISVTPLHDSINVVLNTTVVIEFDETMNRSSVENATTLTPSLTILSYDWDDFDRILTITFTSTLAENTTITVSISTNAKDISGEPLFENYSWSFTTWADADDDGIPDSEDDFPTDPTEDTDTDGDGTGNNADLDDDNDGFLDVWESFLGTNSTDPNDTPLDTDNDGIPDGDTNNTQSWMDMDDDGDGVLDIDDPAPLDPTITTLDDGGILDEDGGIGDYWWILLLMAVIIILSLLFFIRKKPEIISEPEPVLETEICPKCGFEIEKGSACPFCADEEVVEKEPEPPKPKPVEKTTPQKTGLNNEEILARIERAYEEGKMSEGQYLKNLEKFKK